jgi:hypothetical protein
MSLHVVDHGMQNREELLARQAKIKGKILYKSNNDDVSNDNNDDVSNDNNNDDNNNKNDKTSLTKKLILASVSTLLFLVLSTESTSKFSRGIIFFILFLSILYFMK